MTVHPCDCYKSHLTMCIVLICVQFNLHTSDTKRPKQELYSVHRSRLEAFFGYPPSGELKSQRLAVDAPLTSHLKHYSIDGSIQQRIPTPSFTESLNCAILSGATDRVGAMAGPTHVPATDPTSTCPRWLSNAMRRKWGSGGGVKWRAESWCPGARV